jgi:hypothetical protein
MLLRLPPVPATQRWWLLPSDVALHAASPMPKFRVLVNTLLLLLPWPELRPAAAQDAN